MTLSVAIQMDPVSTIDINGDSSFILGLEAQKRGYKLYHYLPKDLSMKGSQVYAKCRPVEFRREQGNHATLGDAQVIDLSTIDVILMRQDPPFDMSYITATHLLDHVHPKTLVVNDPSWVRNCPEKLFIAEFPDLMPPTLITNDLDEIKAFRTEYKDIIVKPLYGNGGAGVFHIKPDDENLNSVFELFEQHYREPIIAQLYLPDVRKGDKRIILIDGEPAGAINRVPAEGEARSNMHVGGRPDPIGLTERDREICAAIGPTLKERGLIFVGIDVIGDYMTEINVTSPTGIQEINRFNNVSLEADIWDSIESKLNR
ncbi:glutathione synthetase [Kiloniella litopenaei]|uniref:Glutathione synthetase n=1 Tax=Kiloniella litopenaei TaxID=1549748 RepID=A0A0M2RB35_9PROT|nr:glutathione synthase [Kiloniella litopenaei]KKJ77190.1 glutathione synthetase [Kiloniella litopenaei]